MNTASASASVHAPGNGATAVSTPSAQAARRRAGAALHALRVFAGAAFSVAVLGDYSEPGVVRHRR